MRRTKSISVVVAAAVLMVGTSACVTSPTLLTELENASLDARVEVLSGLVAEHAGREFKTLPRVSIVDSGAMASEFVAMYRRHADSFFTDIPKQNRDQARNAHASSLSDLLFGAYFPSSGILLNESRIEQEASEAGLSGTKRTQLKLVALAHELIHALQEQIAGAPSKLLSLTDADSINTYGTLLEGHAMVVQRQVAADLGIRAPISDFGSSLPEAKEYDNLADRMSGEMLRYGLDFKYRIGEDYIARFAAAGGMDAVWRVLNDPPTRTVDLLALDNVVVNTGELIDHAASVAEIVSDVYGDECSIVSQPIGYMVLYSIFLGRSTESGAKVLDHLEHGVRHGIQCSGQLLSDAITVMGHHDPSGGESLLSALSEFSMSWLKETNGKYGVEFTEIDSSQSQLGDVEHGKLTYSQTKNDTKTDVEAWRWIGKSLFVEWFKLAEIDEKSAESGRTGLAKLAQPDNR